MDLFLADADATHARGIALARELPKGSVLLLSGELGAGKTSLVQGIAAGLGISEAVTSPTFALAQHYSRPDNPSSRCWCTWISTGSSCPRPPMNSSPKKRNWPLKAVPCWRWNGRNG